MLLFANAMLFDLDGVLADSTPSVNRAWSAWAVRVGLDPADVLPKVHGRRAVDTIRALRPELDPESELALLVADETTDNADVVEIPGARALVSMLPPDAWAIVTSGLRAVATARLLAAGIPLPRVMITAESIVRGKPDPECYLAGAAELGVPPDRCVVVEDAPAGAAAARAAGMRLVGLTTTHAASALQPADIVVPDLAHLGVSIIERTGEWTPTEARLEIRAIA
ncbi:MAG TPA: HAD-IA family hydrolase [Gemmatimonadaceae bacterium]|jgi:sugar-phosphatase|nr:HAD-IA family hydrolase [Gemmatimonadaceae bacterium]